MNVNIHTTDGETQRTLHERMLYIRGLHEVLVLHSFGNAEKFGAKSVNKTISPPHPWSIVY